MASTQLRVAIVGGGIGGLTTAIALRAKGIDATVYEQAPELGEIGAGVLMTPNGVRVLEGLGLGERVAELGATVSEGSSYYRMDGTYIAPILTTDSTGWNGMYGMHRADLVTILSDALPEGVVRTGHRCTHFTQNEHTCRLRFEDGHEAVADVVIAADGIHSTLQQHVTPPSDPVHSGSVAYRGLVPAERVPDWPEGISQLWMGEGKHFLVYRVRRGEIINYVGFVPSDEETAESWSAPGDPEALAEAFTGWDPRVEELLAAVRQTFWWGLYDREPLSSWTNGRLTLLGDAAHPMLPHVGQGANQSIEDAAVLAEVLTEIDAAHAPRALEAYASARRERTAEVQAGARANGLRYDSAYEDLAQRDAEIEASTTFRLWLYDHDALAEGRKLRREVALGATQPST